MKRIIAPFVFFLLIARPASAQEMHRSPWFIGLNTAAFGSNESMSFALETGFVFKDLLLGLEYGLFEGGGRPPVFVDNAPPSTRTTFVGRFWDGRENLVSLNGGYRLAFDWILDASIGAAFTRHVTLVKDDIAGANWVFKDEHTTSIIAGAGARYYIGEATMLSAGYYTHRGFKLGIAAHPTSN